MKGWGSFKGRAVPWRRGSGFTLTRARRCFLCMCLVFTLPLLVMQQALVFCFCGQFLRPDSAVPRLGPTSASYIQYFQERHWREEDVKTALVWDDQFPFSLQEATFAECPVSKCRITRDKGELRTSAAVLFSSRGLWNTFKGYPMPTWRAPHQVWIMSTMEDPPETWLNWRKYNGVFNWTLHYRREADLVGVYGDVVPRDKRGVRAMDMETASAASVRNYAKEKTKMVAWMASNCVDDARRQRVVRELSRYIQVDTYGACGNLPQAGDCKQGTANCEGPVLEPYRFYLALENARCRGYVTEKFFNAMGRAQIPITDNDVHSTGRAPKGSYLQISDFASLKDLAEHLKQLALNETAYNQHLKWRQTHKVQRYTGPWCELCAELHNVSRPAQVYTDLHGWLQNDTCQTWSVCNYVKRVFEGLALYFRVIN